MRPIGLLAIIILASGCATTEPPLACDSGDRHPFEDRCFEEKPAPANEVCTTWLGEGATQSQSVFCQVSSDGHATTHVDFTGTGHLTVYVRNEAGDQLVGQTFGPGEHIIHLDDESGRWRLVTDFSDATGPARVQLWG